ncbi:DUF732 domain-containing protein [Mycolicibacterium diernhoferi]|uniref:DUF732 domain-containing protein n=1 Tax=Mycolicibacterium diernhoferi TaxID=1801 RepID=A0A1Q4HDD8_9MYCO|nr:DUF732 domain-containing protein [Mycolicibacterium diernhoferi]OJZ65475.1 hypothetical protein BRW64_13060 [Mycolicibacterium diernhoferi]OPE49457.1 hypothetical protein BV510_22305 [Mycolicibacterium diernhoferi]PEG52866.1 DUF732 domain-containing protein [Mycolicibacterium diernhoferi]QYL22212.1 DUF732 domain-containing protein [Mycolicibacterium diernhoferi]
MRTRTISGTVAAALLGAATALAAPAAADEQTDQQFLTVIAEHGVQAGDDPVGLAQTMCRKLGNGGKKGVQAALTYIQDNTDLDSEGITTFAGIAAQVYCPDKVKNTE